MKKTFMLCMTWVLKFTPLFLREFLAKLAGNIWFYVSSERREVVKENLTAILGKAEKKDIKKVFINFMKVYSDILNVPNMSRSYLDSIVNLDGGHYIKEELEKGKGLIIVSCHLGGMELAGIYLASLGFPVNSVAESEGPGKDFFDFYKKYRGRFGSNLLPLESKSLPFRLIRVLKENEIVVLIGDRDIANSGTTSEFFGRKAPIPRGAVVLSEKTGAPILVGLLALEHGVKRYSGIIFPPLYPENFSSSDKMLKGVINLMEKGISKYPYQWFVFQRVWQ
jgi:KDO2-lipid IV(A) lauroyltransferase